MEFEKLKKIIADILKADEDSISMDTDVVDDLGADSLDVFQIVMEIEREFDIEIPQERIEMCIRDRGWLAVALVIFALWKPLNAIWGAFLFGALYILYLYIPGLGRSMQEVFKALPYVVTIIVLVFTSFRKKKENQPPAGLGLPYFREDR